MTNSRGQSPSWEADRSRHNQDIPHLYMNLRVHSRIVSQSSVRSIQSTLPHLTFWISVLILSSNLPLGYSSGIFPSHFPTESLYTPLLSSVRATCLTHLVLDLITMLFGEEYRSLSSSLCGLHYLVTSFFLSRMPHENLCLSSLFHKGERKPEQLRKGLRIVHIIMW